MRKLARSALILLALAAPALVLVPLWLLRPFSPQTSAGLALAYALRRASPIATPIALLAALALVAYLFSGGRWWRKAALILALAPIGFATWLARQNIFERMFAPLPGAAYARASEASFVAEGDMVLALERGGDRVAYPVRQIAYHHVLGDVVGGVPVVVTY